MTLELNRLTQAVHQMGQTLAHRQEGFGDIVGQARAWLAEFSGQGAALRDAAANASAAIPTGELLDAVFPLPDLPDVFTVIGADGTQIQPDRHGMAFYYLINVGSLVYRHGSGETPEARSMPDLRYRDEHLYEGRRPVQGNLLDVRRDLAEITHLADLVAQEPNGPTLALVDGTLLLWVLENEPEEKKATKVAQYVEQLERIRHRGAAVAAFTSRPRHAEVGRLLHLAQLGGDVQQAGSKVNPLERIPDRAIFSFLPPGARSALFISPSHMNRQYYAPAEHEICFFYLNVASEGQDPVVARVEIPIWSRQAPESLLALIHGGVVAQSRIAGGFPYVLARADELAFISGPERQQLDEMVGAALLAAGLTSDLSPKATYKTLTRQGRRW